MYVTLSRNLARVGYTVLRFDLSGIGDSEPRAERASPLDCAMADIRDALDFLANAGRASRFVLIGLCSGADHAVLYGHSDSRVVGLVLLDPTIPPTPRYYLHYVAQRLTSLRNWLSVAAGRSGLLRLLAAQLAYARRPRLQLTAITLDNLRFSPYLVECYRNSTRAGIKMFAAFTSNSPRQTYPRQMLDAFPEAARSNTLELEFFPDSDHVFSAPGDRLRLNDAIIAWLGSISPAARS